MTDPAVWLQALRELSLWALVSAIAAVLWFRFELWAARRRAGRPRWYEDRL